MPSVKQSFWLASFNSISVSGTSVVGSQPAIFDTGTSQIVGDTDGIAALFATINGAQPVGDGSYTSAFSGATGQLTRVHSYTYTFNTAVPCTFNTPISFNVGGKAISISPATFNQGPISPGSNTCLAGAAADPNLTTGELDCRFCS